jgi:hypothetical protein
MFTVVSATFVRLVAVYASESSIRIPLSRSILIQQAVVSVPLTYHKHVCAGEIVFPQTLACTEDGRACKITTSFVPVVSDIYTKESVRVEYRQNTILDRHPP